MSDNVIFLDAFTDVNNTPATLHIPTVAGPFVNGYRTSAAFADGLVSDNKLKLRNDLSSYQYITTPSSSLYTLAYPYFVWLNGKADSNGQVSFSVGNNAVPSSFITLTLTVDGVARVEMKKYTGSTLNTNYTFSVNVSQTEHTIGLFVQNGVVTFIVDGQQVNTQSVLTFNQISNISPGIAAISSSGAYVNAVGINDNATLSKSTNDTFISDMLAVIPTSSSIVDAPIVISAATASNVNDFNTYSESFVDYIDEIKPFHTKIRQITTRVDIQDSMTVETSDSAPFIKITQNGVWDFNNSGISQFSFISDGNQVEIPLPEINFPKFSLNTFLPSQYPTAYDPPSDGLSWDDGHVTSSRKRGVTDETFFTPTYKGMLTRLYPSYGPNASYPYAMDINYEAGVMFDDRANAYGISSTPSVYNNGSAVSGSDYTYSKYSPHNLQPFSETSDGWSGGAGLTFSSGMFLNCGSTVVFFPTGTTATAATRNATSAVQWSYTAGQEYVASVLVKLSRALTGSEQIVIAVGGSYPTTQYTITSANSTQFTGLFGKQIVINLPVTGGATTGLCCFIISYGSVLALGSDLTVNMAQMMINKGDTPTFFVKTDQYPHLPVNNTYSVYVKNLTKTVYATPLDYGDHNLFPNSESNAGGWTTNATSVAPTLNSTTLNGKNAVSSTFFSAEPNSQLYSINTWRFLNKFEYVLSFRIKLSRPLVGTEQLMIRGENTMLFLAYIDAASSTQFTGTNGGIFSTYNDATMYVNDVDSRVFILNSSPLLSDVTITVTEVQVNYGRTRCNYLNTDGVPYYGNQATAFGQLINLRKSDSTKTLVDVGAAALALAAVSFNAAPDSFVVRYESGTGRYPVQFHQGSYVTVNGVQQIFGTDYVVESTRNAIQFLAGKHPTSNQALRFNIFTVDKMFFAETSPFSVNLIGELESPGTWVLNGYDETALDDAPYGFTVYGTSQYFSDMWTVTIDTSLQTKYSSFVFTNLSPSVTNKPTLQNFRVLGQAVTGDVWHIVASGPWAVKVYKNSSTNIDYVSLGETYNNGSITFTLDRNWVSYYWTPDENRYQDFSLAGYGLQNVISHDPTDFQVNINLKAQHGTLPAPSPTNAHGVMTNQLGYLKVTNDNGVHSYSFMMTSPPSVGTMVNIAVEQHTQSVNDLSLGTNDVLNLIEALYEKDTALSVSSNMGGVIDHGSPTFPHYTPVSQVGKIYDDLTMNVTTNGVPRLIHTVNLNTLANGYLQDVAVNDLIIQFAPGHSTSFTVYPETYSPGWTPLTPDATIVEPGRIVIKFNTARTFMVEFT